LPFSQAVRWLIVDEAPNGGMFQADQRLVPALDVLERTGVGRSLLDMTEDAGSGKGEDLW
jgi:hypothetical protein